MNTLDISERDSRDNNKRLFPHIALAVSAVLFTSCSSSFDGSNAGNSSIRYQSLPYRPLSELGNVYPDISDGEDLSGLQGLRDFMARSSTVYSDEEFVGDDGTVYTREELLESRY